MATIAGCSCISLEVGRSCQAASPLRMKVALMDPSRDCLAVVARHVGGSVSAVQKVAKRCCVLTVETEQRLASDGHGNGVANDNASPEKSRATLTAHSRQVLGASDDVKESASVGIIMGSDSDLHIMKHAAQVLDCFGVHAEVNLVSAHRTAEWMFEYAKNAHTNGLKVIIAGAGGSAHLPGMVDSISPLAVIGVPINATPLQGIDSLLSIVQMPAGVPVATVPIDDAQGAGMLAVRLLALSDEQLRQRITCKDDGGKLEHFKTDAQLLRSLDKVDGNEHRSGTPVVGIVVSSISDLQPAKDAAAVLNSFGLQYEIVPLSKEYVKNVHTKGVRVMVAGTGLSVDLPVLVSRATPLPVIGIPTQRDHPLEPLVVQREAPVAWVAVDNGMNAGLLAVRFLASGDASLIDKMKCYQQEMKSGVMAKAMKLQALGWKKYVQELLP